MSNSRHWQLSADGGTHRDADDIARCIQIILTTRRGTDVTRPTFGSGHLDYVDAPTDVLIPNMVREIHLAIGTWEKRAVIKNVYFTGQAPHLTMTIEWVVADQVAGEIYKIQLEL